MLSNVSNESGNQFRFQAQVGGTLGIILHTMKKLYLVFIIFITGCLRTPSVESLPARFIDRIPKPNEFVGLWSLNINSIEEVKAYKKENGFWDSSFDFKSFALNSDSTVVILASNSNSIMNHYSQETKTLSGRWFLKNAANYSGNADSNFVVEIEIISEGSKDGEISGTSIFGLNIYEENGALILWDYLGDPDHVKYLDFNKK